MGSEDPHLRFFVAFLRFHWGDALGVGPEVDDPYLADGTAKGDAGEQGCMEGREGETRGSEGEQVHVDSSNETIAVAAEAQGNEGEQGEVDVNGSDETMAVVAEAAQDLSMHDGPLPEPAHDLSTHALPQDFLA